MAVAPPPPTTHSHQPPLMPHQARSATSLCLTVSCSGLPFGLTSSFLQSHAIPLAFWTRCKDQRNALICDCYSCVALEFAVAFFFLPVLWYDYGRYLCDIGDKQKELSKNPEDGVTHGLITWLYTRYLKHPWMEIDVHNPDEVKYILHELPLRKGPPPQMMEGLPQRQLTQLPPQHETDVLKGMVFQGLFKVAKEVEVGRSLLEGTGAMGVR